MKIQFRCSFFFQMFASHEDLVSAGEVRLLFFLLWYNILFSIAVYFLLSGSLDKWKKNTILWTMSHRASFYNFFVSFLCLKLSSQSLMLMHDKKKKTKKSTEIIPESIKTSVILFLLTICFLFVNWTSKSYDS